MDNCFEHSVIAKFISCTPIRLLPFADVLHGSRNFWNGTDANLDNGVGRFDMDSSIESQYLTVTFEFTPGSLVRNDNLVHRSWLL